MFDELNKYKINNHFFFKQNDKLSDVCNAPTDKSGVYIVYALSKGRIDLVYIGRSGEKKPDGNIFVRKASLGGIKDRIVNGHQFGKIPRKISWINQMKIENIEALDVYWYATHDIKCNDCPKEVENSLLQKYYDLYQELPRWNNRL
jgi:hypothetical protein